MAQLAKMTVNVKKTQTKSQVRVATAGSYASLVVNTVKPNLTSQPLYTTAGPKAFWLAVLADVTAAVNALPGP